MSGPRIVELPPIGKDGRCSGCGGKPNRETGRCACVGIPEPTPRPTPGIPYIHDAPCQQSGTEHTHEVVTDHEPDLSDVWRDRAYRPHSVTERRAAIRCAGCHRVPGNCTCGVVIPAVARVFAHHEDELDTLARQLHESIADGQTLAETAKLLRILTAEPDVERLVGAVESLGCRGNHKVGYCTGAIVQREDVVAALRGVGRG